MAHLQVVARIFVGKKVCAGEGDVVGEVSCVVVDAVVFYDSEC